MTQASLAEVGYALSCLKCDLAWVEVSRALKRLVAAGDRLKYDPNQPRVPAGSSEGGQWTDGGRGSGGSSEESRLPRNNINDYLPDVTSPNYSNAIKPEYPVEIALGLLLGRPAASLAARVLTVTGVIRATGALRSPLRRHTEHETVRSEQRNITDKQIQDAMRTAKETGNVTTKLGNTALHRLFIKVRME